MAAQILQDSTPTLVTAFSTHVQPLLDQFFAKGLITDEFYVTILESSSSSLDKARNVLRAIKDVIETDDNCFVTVLSILKELFGSDDKLVLYLKDEYQKFTLQPPCPKRLKLRRVSSDPTDQQSAAANGEFPRHFSVLPEVRVLQVFTPNLVSVLSSYVNNVLDQCLSEGIIPGSLHKKLLELTSSENKVRELLQATRSSINVDRRCFKIFLSILKETVPSAIREKLLSAIKIEYEKLSKADTNSNYPNISSASDHLLQEFELAGRNASSNFKHVVDQFKESVKEHTRACVEKEVLEDELAKKRKENEQLNKELEMAMKTGGTNDDNIKQLRERLAVCESEIAGIIESIVKIGQKIDLHCMNVKRGESFAREEYREMSESHSEAKQAESEKSSKIQELMGEIEQLKGSNAVLEASNRELTASVEEYELVNQCLHSQLHSPYCTCLKSGKNLFIVKYIK